MISRRKAIALVGGGFVVAAGTFAGTRTPHAAFAPWDLAGSYDDPRLNALSYGLLAPNPHNLQPWKVALEGEDRVRIFRDTTRGLPETDPFDRQITIGFGCFLEQTRIAASGLGKAVDWTLFPEGETDLVAEGVFQDGASPDPLVPFMMSRRSCKEPYEPRAVEDDKAAALEGLADIYRETATVEALRALTREAFSIEALTPHTLQESIDVMRIGKREIIANPDGIDLGGVFFDSLKLVGALSPEAIADTDGIGFRQNMEQYQTMLQATPAYAVIVTDGNTRADQIEAGRRWLRLNLTTTQQGLGLHPVSQCLQEYPEMSELYAFAHDLLAQEGQTVQMLGRLGYGPQVSRTPRWPLEAKRIE
jgi:hypothetical protein